MFLHIMRIVVPAAVLLIGLPLSAMAFKEGPYPNVTGGFGERSCHLCHLDNPVNAPGGTLTLSGVPATYALGQTYAITVSLAREGMRRGGFEIASRFAGGKQNGKQAGSWKVPDARLQLIPGAVDKSLTFVQHNLQGSRTATPGSNTWTIEWTAPSPAPGSGSTVQFNVAANASNNDDSALGDYIYVKAVRSARAR
jgi:hypothetical protein